MKFDKLRELAGMPEGKPQLLEENLASLASLGKYGDPMFFVKSRASNAGYTFGPFTDIRIWNEEKQCNEPFTFKPEGYVDKNYKPQFFVKAENALNVGSKPILLREDTGGKEAKYTVWDEIAKPVVRDHVLREAVKANGDILSLQQLISQFPDETVPDLVATLCQARGEEIITEASGDLLDMTGGDLAFIDSGVNVLGTPDTVKYMVVKEDSQLKLGDLQVRDDRGQIVPLDRRFDPTNDDIRF